jgi:hypothetical protein
MGFYYKNNYDTVLTFNNKSGESDSSFYSEGIELINNEPVTFDFSDYVQNYSVGDILLEIDTEETNDVVLHEKSDSALGLEAEGFLAADCLYKITIDCKDGTIIVLDRPTDKNPAWLKTTHTPFFSNEEYYNLSDDISTWPTIDIIIFNLYGIRNNIKVPFRLKKSSFTQSGIKLKLIAANITNNNKVAYIFNDENNNQLILAKNDIS